MKVRRLLVIVIFILAFSFISGCVPASSTKLVNSEEQSELGTVSEKKIPAYKDLPFYLKELSAEMVSSIQGERNLIDTAKVIPIKENKSGKVLSIHLPNDFTVEDTYADNDIYILSVNGTAVGECRFNDLKIPKCAKKVSQEGELVNNNLGIARFNLQCSYENESWEVPIYRILFQQTSGFNNAVVYIRRDVLNYDQVMQIALSMQFKYLSSATKAGEKDFSDSDCNILILGNSFIYTSQIESILRDIAYSNKTRLDVKAESIGYATVDTFAKNEDILELLKSGEFDVVFLCGFYGNYIDSLNALLNIKSEETKLVIFPAHNEGGGFAYENFELNPITGLADWKGLIDNIIYDGMDPLRLYYDDYYHHSNNLAGYAGACLIYSYLYKSVPDAGFAEGLVIEEQVEQFGSTEEQVLSDLSDIRKRTYNFLYN